MPERGATQQQQQQQHRVIDGRAMIARCIRAVFSFLGGPHTSLCFFMSPSVNESMNSWMHVYTRALIRCCAGATFGSKLRFRVTGAGRHAARNTGFGPRNSSCGEKKMLRTSFSPVKARNKVKAKHFYASKRTPLRVFWAYLQ